MGTIMANKSVLRLFKDTSNDKMLDHVDPITTHSVFSVKGC